MINKTMCSLFPVVIALFLQNAYKVKVIFDAQNVYLK